MRHIARCLMSLAVLAGSLSAGFGYTKPALYDKDHNSIILQNQYLYSPHSWIIVKAIEHLEKDGFPEEAALARRHLLPMIEGVTFNDVWGDADLAGASILDYYVPDSPNENYGFGSAFLAYHNPTWTYADLAFYGYGNAAEYSQFKYDYAKRIYLGDWGTDFHDLTAGWVVDDLIGQSDPQSGNWFQWSLPIDPNGGVNPQGTNFGNNRTPADIMADLTLNFRHGFVFDPNQADPDDRILNLPSSDVFEHQEDWLEDHYGSADQVEAYNGFDGQGYAVYANWTYDAGGVGQNCGGCMLAATTSPLTDTCDAASPMLVRFPVNSKPHAFFQLGWAIHLVEDVSTPVHTINDSVKTANIHNDVEKIADEMLGPGATEYNNQIVKDLLPATVPSDLANLYPFPPPPIGALINGQFISLPCGQGAPDPTAASYFKTSWYADTLARDPGEGVAHAYVRQTAELSHSFMPYLDCMDQSYGRAEWDWNHMGFFTAYGLDVAIKSTAGLIRQFIEDVDKTAPAVTIAQPVTTGYTRLSKFTLDYSAADDESGVKSVTATMDGSTMLKGHGLTSGQLIDVFGELSLGDHTFEVSATDNAGNATSSSVIVSVIVTAASIQDDVRYFVSKGDITLNDAKPLLSKLAAAAAYRAAGDCVRANATYLAFINQLNAQLSKKVALGARQFLIEDAQYLMAHCP